MEIQKLHHDGLSVSEISRQLNMNRKTVRRYLLSRLRIDVPLFVMGSPAETMILAAIWQPIRAKTGQIATVSGQFVRRNCTYLSTS
jgi:transposase